MAYIEIDTFKILNSLPSKGKFEHEQCGTSPTDLVYRWVISLFKHEKKEYTISFMTMKKIMDIIEKEAL